MGKKYEYQDGKVVCPGCGKLFDGPRSLGPHSRVCPNYPKNMHGHRLKTDYNSDGNKIYICPGCGYSSTNLKSVSIHVSKCRQYLGEERYMKFIELQRIKAHKPKPGRSKAFAEGRLIPTHGSMFKSSYFRNYYLRSSYEAIYAAWLLWKNIEFEYETISLEYADSYNTYTPDFYINKLNRLIEIKGSWTNKLYRCEELCLANGYDYELILGDKIWEYYDDLKNTDTKFCELYLKIMRSNKDNRIKWDYVDGNFIIK